MAEKRMFAKTMVDSDSFLDMPPTAQNLYFALGIRADDDGIVNNPKAIARLVQCEGDNDIKLLIEKKFVIPLKSGIIAIKHWNINNTIRKDTYTETKYKDEKSLLSLDDNKAYTLMSQERNVLDTELVIVEIPEPPVENTKPEKKTVKEKSADIFESYTQNPELLSALKDFEKMRKEIKKPMTDRAKSLLIAELGKLADNDTKKIAIINQSILHSWQSVFELKPSATNKQQNTNETHSYDLEAVMKKSFRTGVK